MAGTHSLYAKFIARLGQTVKASEEQHVDSLLEEAVDKLLDIIGRDELPVRLQSLAVKLAVIAYNMQGAEGESSRSEGGISRAFEALPEDDKMRLNNYPRKVGAIHAAHAERHDNVQPSEGSGSGN